MLIDGSCYIYQPQYLGAALSRTNGLPIGDAITGSAGGGPGCGEEMGTWQGLPLLALPPPQSLPQAPGPAGCSHGMCCRLLTERGQSSQILIQMSPGHPSARPL